MADLGKAEQDSLKQTANALADVAQVETLRHFRSADLQADNKETDSFDPVTVADRAAETAMRDLLAKMRPDDAILGEEFGYTKGTSGLTWVLDPIDGTRSYISGTPTWGVLISVRDDSGPFFGMIVQPYIGERFIGGLGEARMIGPHGEVALKTRKARPLSQCRMLSTFPAVGTREERAAFDTVRDQVQLTRFGTDCYGYAMIAAGQVDLVVEAGLQPYDVQAPIAVVQAAGGVITDWNGNPAHEGGRLLAAANPQVHAAALEILQNALKE
ncbi:MAG TPA: histidinol-phosphatase [Rhodobacteraceae bacterium]|jgi:myo-inositol-1(or 4)-monophosphatase|nr:histidinol-phosphatase [Paracoccaceae bacterium]